MTEPGATLSRAKPTPSASRRKARVSVRPPRCRRATTTRRLPLRLLEQAAIDPILARVGGADMAAECGAVQLDGTGEHGLAGLRRHGLA